MLREARRAGSELGKRVAAVMDSGGLVSDDLVIAIVEERLGRSDAKTGFILDGFPRTIPQAEALDGLLRKMGRAAAVAVSIQVPREELIVRLGGRLSCPKDGASYHIKFNPPKRAGTCDVCGTALIERADDKPEAIANRLNAYERDTAPLIDFYGRKALLRMVDGIGQPDEILDRIARSVEG
jgi:adenylate kinase